jgi:hypothetical protein
MSATVACATCGRIHPIDQSELTFGLPDVVFGDALLESYKRAGRFGSAEALRRLAHVVFSA